MTAKPAKPERYTVDRTGTPDPPSSEYYVLDLVNDLDARTVLAQLGNLYRRRGSAVRAKEAFDALHVTQDAHKKIVELRNGQEKKATSKQLKSIPN